VIGFLVFGGDGGSCVNLLQVLIHKGFYFILASCVSYVCKEAY